MFVRVGIAVLHSCCNSKHSAGRDSFQSGVGACVAISRSSNGGSSSARQQVSKVSNLKFEHSTKPLSRLNFRVLQDSYSISILFHPVLIQQKRRLLSAEKLTGHFAGKTFASVAEATHTLGTCEETHQKT